MGDRRRPATTPARGAAPLSLTASGLAGAGSSSFEAYLHADLGSAAAREKPMTDFYRHRKGDAVPSSKDEAEWLRNSAAKGDWLADRVERFRQLCMRLNMDELTTSRAADILHRRHQRLPSSAFTPEYDGDASWGICALWVAGRVQTYPEGANSRSQTFNGVSLNQLLDANRPAKSVPEFLEELKRFLDDPSLEAIPKEKRDLLGPDVERLQQSHSRLLLVFNRFNETFPLLFPSTVNESVQRDLARFAWYLFLIAKGSLRAAFGGVSLRALTMPETRQNRCSIPRRAAISTSLS